MVSADSVVLVSLWEAPTSPSGRDGCSDVEASREMDMADASMSEVRIFILLLLGSARTNGRWRCRGER
jgi:hypothetical protein